MRAEKVLFPGEPTPDLEPRRAGRIGKILEGLRIGPMRFFFWGNENPDQ
jgi:hypothetical protein